MNDNLGVDMDIILWIVFVIGLIIAYMLLWFLGSAVLFLITSGKSPALKMEGAFSLGLISAVAHVLCYWLYKLYVELGG
jgi:hypothetical protein